MMVFCSLIVVGLIATRLLPLEFMPNITFPGAYVALPYPNSTPKETEERIIRPIEEVLSTISGVEQINSNSGENDGGVVVLFKQGNDIGIKAIEIKEKIESIRNQLPDDFEYYDIYKFQDGDAPLLQLRVSSEKDLSDSYDLLNRNLKQRIERVPGVGQVELYGAEKKQFKIELIANRIISYSIDLNQLMSRLQRSNFSVSAGKITDAGFRYNVRPVGELTSVEDIGNLIVGENNLRLSDIANVSYTSPRRNYARHLDQKYAIGIDVVKESDANTVQVVEDVLEEIEQASELPEMQGIVVYEMFNQAEGIISSLRELLKSGMIGALLSIFVLYLFLRQFSTTLVVALAVPFSLIVTLGFFYFLDISLNILSMMGLMLAIGMLVDNAVVVTENIHRYQKKMKDNKKAAFLGAREVSVAVTAGTLTSIIVFLPNVVNESFISQHMYYVGMAIIISLIASLLISLTVIPLLTSRIKPPKEIKRTFIDAFADQYAKLLSWTLRHRVVAVSGMVGIFLSTGVIMGSGLLGVDMFPEVEERRIFLQYNLNGAYTLDRVKQAVDRVEEYLYDHQEEFEIESVYTYYQNEFAQSTINLVAEDESRLAVREVKRLIEEDLPVITIGELSFEYVSRSGGESIQVFVNGESINELEKLADEVERRLAQIEGFADVRSEAEAGTDEIRLKIDRVRARNYGLTTNDIATMVSSSMRGQNLRKVRGEFGEIDLFVEFQNADRQSITDLRELPVSSPTGESVKLSTITDFEMGSSPSRIFRQNRRTSLGINVNLDGMTSDEARGAIEKVMNQINYPNGYGWSFGRFFDNNNEALNVMLFNILIAFVLIYMVIASLFESVLQPSGIMTCILFGVIGVFYFFAITGTTFDLMAIIGILILMGIVVNNGIVLVDHIHTLRKEGLNRREAVIQAGKDRMRPILMTAGTTVLGLIPLAFSTTLIGGQGGPPYFPMARAIVGGLTFSTVVTLLILPTIYVILDDIGLWSSRIFRMARK